MKTELAFFIETNPWSSAFTAGMILFLLVCMTLVFHKGNPPKKKTKKETTLASDLHPIARCIFALLLLVLFISAFLIIGTESMTSIVDNNSLIYWFLLVGICYLADFMTGLNLIKKIGDFIDS